MVTDQEPRYRLKDFNGNIVGTVFERGGEIVVQEGASGNENEFVLQSDGTVQAKRLAGGYLYAGAFDGSDPDARLDNALAAANGGDRIFLENDDYDADRTIGSRVTLEGPRAGFSTATLNAQWTIGFDEVEVTGIEIFGGVTVNEPIATLTRVSLAGAATVDVNADDFRLTNSNGTGSVNFASGTSGGLVDSVVGGISVTDNGSNTTGDLG